MSWLDSPTNIMLAVALLFGAGLGFGGVTGKGWLLLNGLRKNGKNGNGSKNPLQDLLPCKEHSGLVADVKNLVKSNEEVKAEIRAGFERIHERIDHFHNGRGGKA